MTGSDFLDEPPQGDTVTDYDRRHSKLYIRLLDAEADGASWQEAVEVLFGIDPVREAARAKKVHAAHLARARWMTEQGYRHLLREARH